MTNVPRWIQEDAQKEAEWTIEMQRAETEHNALRAELEAQLEELKVRCGVAEHDENNI